jgi:glycosyltransferase involved in cell wall biosynthesis
MPDQKKLLIIGKVWPEPKSSAAGSRMVQLIQLFLDDGWQITFSSSASQSDYSFDLNKIGVDQKPIKMNDSSFDEFIQVLKPDMVLFDRFMIEEQFGWRVSENCPNAVRILDTIDLHSLRLARQNAFKEGREFNVQDLLVEDTAKREIASILRSDLSLIISDIEMKILKEIFEIDEQLLFYLPYLLNFENGPILKDAPGFDDRKGFVSIGNFKHEPNWNAVIWMKEEIWPLIKKQLPEAKLYLYGSYPSKKVFQLSNPDDGFLIKGRASDALSVISKARVLLAPLRFGAGLKGKLVDAALSGTPSVTTSIGAEGIELGCKWNGVISNDIEQFANAAVQLYKNKEFWETSQKTGYELLKKRFDLKKFDSSFLKKIIHVRQNLDEQRQQNFIGAMLRHHTMNSTKFMSRWIEEKNK